MFKKKTVLHQIIDMFWKTHCTHPIDNSIVNLIFKIFNVIVFKQLYLSKRKVTANKFRYQLNFTFINPTKWFFGWMIIYDFSPKTTFPYVIPYTVYIPT